MRDWPEEREDEYECKGRRGGDEGTTTSGDLACMRGKGICVHAATRPYRERSKGKSWNSCRQYAPPFSLRRIALEASTWSE